MLKKINIQVGLFIMLSIGLSACGGGKSKGDKGKASTPAARKAKMEKVLKGPAGIALRKEIMEIYKKGAKKAPGSGNASMDKAQREVALAIGEAYLDQNLTQLVENLSLEEKITLADLQNCMDDIGASLEKRPGIPEDLLPAMKTNYKELVHLLVKAHGGLQQ